MLSVLHLSRRCCPRVFKQGRELIMSGLDVSFLSQSVPDAVKTILPSQHFWQSREDLGAKLKALRPDLVHAHEEPMWLGHFAKSCLPDVPVVFDIHDSDHFRLGGDHEDERKSLCDADAVVFPSKTYQRVLSERYGVRLSAVIYSMVNLADYPEEQLPRVNGIVYEGGVTVTDPDKRAKGRHNINDYRPLAVALYKQGIAFHVYGGRANQGVDAYLDAGVVWHPSYQLQILLKQLTRYDWGLVGSPFKNKQWDAAMPNKLFEYVAAGIPCLVYNAAEAAEYVEKHHLGAIIRANTSGQAAKLIHFEIKRCEHIHYRRRVKALRREHSMASQMPQLINLYTEAIKSVRSRSLTDMVAEAAPVLAAAAT